MNQYVISGLSRSGKTYFANQVFDKENTIRLIANNTHPYNITDELYQKIINKRQASNDYTHQTLIVDELNYGMMPTHIMQGVINRITKAADELNHNSDEPVIDNIVWIGTRKTLIHLICENLIYHVMDPEDELVSFNIARLTAINGHKATDAFLSNDNPFQVFQATTTVNN